MSDTTLQWVASGVAALCFAFVIGALLYTLWIVRQTKKDQDR